MSIYLRDTTLEADKLALIWLLQAEKWPAGKTAKQEALRDILFSVGIVFLVFECAKQGRLADSTSKTHPDPALRLAHLIEDSRQYLLTSDRQPFSDSRTIDRSYTSTLVELAAAERLIGLVWFNKIAQTMLDSEQAIPTGAGRRSRAASSVTSVLPAITGMRLPVSIYRPPAPMTQTWAGGSAAIPRGRAAG